MAKIRRHLRFALLCMSLVGCGAKDGCGASVEPAAVAVAPSSSAPIHGGLDRTVRRVDDRIYVTIEPRNAAWAIAVERSVPAQADVLLSVAGTYTSPDNEVEGLVMLDGRVLRRQAKPWQGMLVVVGGEAELHKVEGHELDEALVQSLRSQRASVLQGHLLVFDGRAEALKPSPALQRRALATTAAGSMLVESDNGVALDQFADDLVALGASAALNLDMGAWSEGWYRLQDGATRKLGRDWSATHRQSNWLLCKTR